ncbi:MAG: hypothetical protein JRI22_22285, partial [Deltaproteobacteria bacterium]|nr:hypothetical protein [Deltaproteobacteria bacterium]
MSTSIGAVRFDALIELDRTSSRSLRHTHTLIFGRYWVARHYYCAAVVWAEPQSTDLFFPVRPPTLSFASNEHSFTVRHELNTKHNVTYEKPVHERGVLRHKFGSYPIGNIRFGEREALAERIYAADLGALKAGDKSEAEVVNVAISGADSPNARGVTRLKVGCNRERIDSMQLFNGQNQMLKHISYDYESKEDKLRLRSQTVALPERPMMVGFNGEGIKVTLDGKEYRYRDLKATHHAGGRTCTVEYESVRLGDKEISLPVQVTVRRGKDGRILRSVRMMNFKQVELDAAGAEEAASKFAGFTADQHKYWQLREKYWDKGAGQVEEEDVETIRQLRTWTEKDEAIRDDSTGEKLKHLNVLIELNRILGDELELERHYQAYLSTLRESKLGQMTLVGGYGVIETSMFRGRRSEAARLLGRWVDAALENNDTQCILLFARRQLIKKRLWTTAVLLEALSNRRQLSPDARFEAEGLRCWALSELCKLLGIDN